MSEEGALARDAWAGLASTLVVLPSAIAFGALVFSPLGASPAGALAGIVGAIAIGVVAPLFGGTKRMISGPSAPAAAVLTALSVKLSGLHVSPAHAVFLLALCSTVAGALQFAYGAIGGGRLVKYIPYPVAAGYLSAVGVMIFLSQVPRAAASTETLIVAGATVALTALSHRLTKAVPASIVGLAGGVAVYFALGVFKPELLRLDGNPLLIGGLASSGSWFASWRAGAALAPDELRVIGGPILTLSVLLSFDTLKTCVLVDNFSAERHDSDKELRGQGLANMASALAGGLSGSGISGATMVNIEAGARTNRSALVSAALCLAAFAAGRGVIAWLPLSALAGVLIVVAFRMVDFKVFGWLRRGRKAFDFFVVASVIGVAIGVNLMAASAVGVGLSILLFIRDQITASIIRRKTSGSEVFSRQNRLPNEMKVLEERGGQTLICELQGALFFGTADQLYGELEKDIPSRKFVILDLRRVQALDFTAMHVLGQLQKRLAERGGMLLYCDVPPRVAPALDVEPARVFSELDDALTWTEDKLLAEQKAWPRESAPPLALEQIEALRGLSGLRGLLEERVVPAGQKVFIHGQAGDQLFVIRKGRVRIELPITKGKAHHLATFARGDIFGEMAFFDAETRSADATAVSETHLFVLSRRSLESKDPALSSELYARLGRVLALRLRRTDNELRALQAD